MRLLSTVALGLFLLQRYAIAETNFPPFTAEASISHKNYLPNEPQPYREINYRAYFSYSNSWWRIRLDRLTSDDKVAVSVDCMSIPEGIRHYAIFPGDTNVGYIRAIACPISFPPPGNGALLTTWLALCPHPNLPLKDGLRIRRFLSAPDCQSEMLNHPRNEGYYLLDYFGPQRSFVSQLMVTNNGLDWNIDGDVKPYSAPYDKGFLESKYELVATTNVDGIIFPWIGRFQGFMPIPQGSAIYRAITFEIEVKQISLAIDSIQDSPRVDSFFASDFRPRGLPGGAHIGYVVTDDNWKPSADRTLQHLTHAAAGVSKKSVSFGGQAWLAKTVLLIAMICPLVIYAIWNSTKTRKEKS